MRDETAPHMARIKAAEVLLNRGWGQAPQTITLTDESAAPVDVLELARRVAYLLAFAERQAQAEDAELLQTPAILLEEEKEQT